jgi:hypothetical protein
LTRAVMRYAIPLAVLLTTTALPARAGPHGDEK